MVVLKHKFEDFIVREILGIEVSQNSSGIHIYLLKKQNYTSERAVTHISKALRLPRKFIGYAGTKDKPAITYQYISIKGASREKVEALDLKDLSLEFIGYAKEDIRLGKLQGNSFEIVLRDLPNIKKIELDDFFIPNYFDEQRFSTNNLRIGLELLKNNYKEAVDILIKDDKDFSERLKEHLTKQKNDFVGALKILPRKTILFFVHSVQSYFFNEILAEKIKESSETNEVEYSQGKFVFNNFEKLDMEELPLIGYLIKDYDEILAKKDLNHRSFLIRSLPEFSLEGDFRKAFFEVKNFSMSELEDDEEFKGKKKCLIKFDLGSGSYATIVIRALLAKEGLGLHN